MDEERTVSNVLSDYVSKLQGLLQLLFPPVCVFCGRVLEAGKRSEVSRDLPICHKCLANLPLYTPEETLRSCLSNREEDDPIPDFQTVVAFHYTGFIRDAIRGMKFHDAIIPAESMSQFLVSAILLQHYSFDVVIPIPLSVKRRSRRGYNQAELIARPVAKALGIPCVASFLVRVMHTRQQSRFVDPRMRKANVSGAFSVGSDCDVTGLSVLVVDDVTTTGATLHEAAVALYKAGARFVVGASLAAGRS